MGLTRLTDDLFVHHGAINVGILRQGHSALLFDYGDGDVQQSLRELGIERVDTVLFTHHHRDQASGAYRLAADGTRVGVPAAERELFAHVERYWNDPGTRWHLSDMRPHNLMLACPLPVHAAHRQGDRIAWGRYTISVLESPGHTDGSLSYVLEADGVGRDVRYAFSGDVIYGEGQLWDLYSLQKGWTTRDYHGYLGDRRRLAESLRRLAAAEVEALIPSHGQIIPRPRRAIDLLCTRLEASYAKYAAVSALRHYYPEMFVEFAGHPEAMPIGKGRAPPDFLHHLGTSWVVSSQDGPAMVVDCGSEAVVRGIEALQRGGKLGEVEWLWITHYHDDHVDAIPSFREAYGCPVVADEHVAQVVENPLAWRLPCISPRAIEVDRRTKDGESWQWHEFRVTAYHLPGQTLYHGGLLMKGRGMRVLFAGDSFTMAGMDDYCPGNRNPIGAGEGFDACVALVERLEPDLILNCHVDAGFAFTAQQCSHMRRNLAQRERLYRELLPWDHPNYGLDEHWVRCHPYEQRAAPGGCVLLEVVLTNHSVHESTATCRPVLPDWWHGRVSARSTAIPAKCEGGVAFELTVPEDAPSGRWVVPVDVTYQGRRLGQFREAVLQIAEP